MANQNPEQIARDKIDRQLGEAGWDVQDKRSINLNKGAGQAVREYTTEVGPADDVLFVGGTAVGVVEAKKGDVGAEYNGGRGSDGGVYPRQAEMGQQRRASPVSLRSDGGSDSLHRHPGPETPFARALYFSPTGDAQKLAGGRKFSPLSDLRDALAQSRRETAPRTRAARLSGAGYRGIRPGEFEDGDSNIDPRRDRS